jgi:hypothetical protein
MALDFPNAPTNGQIYTATSGEQWIYEAATNSWTSKGLVNTAGGLQYKGDVNITAVPPAGVASGSQYSVNPGGTANAGFGPGVTGTVAKGSMLMYTGTGWIETNHAVAEATPAVKGIDTRKWNRVGTVLSPATAGDVVNISAGTAALPGLTPVGDPDTGIYSPGADQVAVATKGVGRLFVDASGNVGVGRVVNGVPLAAALDGPGERIPFIISNSDVAANNGAGIHFAPSNSVVGASIMCIAESDFSAPANRDGALSFRTRLNDSALGSSERLRVTSAGLVGIGTSAPGSPLSVQGSDNSVIAHFHGRTGTNTRGLKIGLATNVTANHLVDLNAVGTDGTLTFSSNSNEKGRLTSSGQLLVGTSTNVGSSSNTAPVVAGTFMSFQGSASSASKTEVDLFTLPNGNASYLITAIVKNGANAVLYSSCYFVGTNLNSSAVIAPINVGTFMVLTLNGMVVRGTQSSGVPNLISWSVTRIANL